MHAVPEIPPFLDRRPFIGTYSILNSYDNCAHACYRRYILRDQPFVETTEMIFGNKVHEALELRVRSGKPLPQDMEHWEQFATPFDGKTVLVEQKLGITKEGRACDFWDKNVWFRGKVDNTLINGTKAFITDFKTGSSRFEDPFELETSALLIKASYPQITTFFGNYVWLKENRIGQLYNLSDIQGIFSEVGNRIAEILASKQANVWEKKKSGLCSWCSVSDCENWKPRT